MNLYHLTTDLSSFIFGDILAFYLGRLQRKRTSRASSPTEVDNVDDKGMCGVLD
ncbi:hypothetical protein [Musicola keenii]|uniref:hypothetical protein n=1 Tax=Musicola keenii TaxID=2884250 RepID=UPI0017803930|nr:hypothetical protein [Musicola keenii]